MRAGDVFPRVVFRGVVDGLDLEDDEGGIEEAR